MLFDSSTLFEGFPGDISEYREFGQKGASPESTVIRQSDPEAWCSFLEDLALQVCQRTTQPLLITNLPSLSATPVSSPRSSLSSLSSFNTEDTEAHDSLFGDFDLESGDEPLQQLAVEAQVQRRCQKPAQSSSASPSENDIWEELFGSLPREANGNRDDTTFDEAVEEPTQSSPQDAHAWLPLGQSASAPFPVPQAHFSEGFQYIGGSPIHSDPSNLDGDTTMQEVSDCNDLSYSRLVDEIIGALLSGTQDEVLTQDWSALPDRPPPPPPESYRSENSSFPSPSIPNSTPLCGGEFPLPRPPDQQEGTPLEVVRGSQASTKSRDMTLLYDYQMRREDPEAVIRSLFEPWLACRCPGVQRSKLSYRKRHWRFHCRRNPFRQLPGFACRLHCGYHSHYRHSVERHQESCQRRKNKGQDGPQLRRRKRTSLQRRGTILSVSPRRQTGDISADVPSLEEDSPYRPCACPGIQNSKWDGNRKRHWKEDCPENEKKRIAMFQCYFCEHSTKRTDNLKQHMVRKHGLPRSTRVSRKDCRVRWVVVDHHGETDAALSTYEEEEPLFLSTPR